MRKLMLLLVFLSCAATPAMAERELPVNAKRATVGTLQPLPLVQLNNDILRVAPGGVVIDTHNRTVTHSQLRPGSEILYQLDRAGDITRIIVLTPQEQYQFDNAK